MEKARTRVLAQVDAAKAARTSATLARAVEEWLAIAELEASTRLGYRSYIDRYIGPALGSTPIKNLTVQTLDQYYASLRRCRATHRTTHSVAPRLAYGASARSRRVEAELTPGRPPRSSLMARDLRYQSSASSRWPPVLGDDAQLVEAGGHPRPVAEPPVHSRSVSEEGGGYRLPPHTREG